MRESTRWCARIAFDVMSTIESKARYTHGLRAKIGRTHVWVGMYQFETNRVRLGPKQVGFGPGLCPGRPNPFKYPWGAPLCCLDYV
jgi:hypothetical protein